LLGRTGKTSTMMFRGRSRTVCSFSSSRRFRRGWKRHLGRGTPRGGDLEQDSWLRAGCEQSVPLTSRLKPPTLSREVSSLEARVSVNHVSYFNYFPHFPLLPTTFCMDSYTPQGLSFLMFPFSTILSLLPSLILLNFKPSQVGSEHPTRGPY